MATDLTNNDSAGTVVSRINTAIEEQNKGVSQLGVDPNADTVISHVNAAIDAESNDQLEDVTNSDNAADFIRKTNALFASIRNGGDEPTPPEPDYAYWNEKKYIAFGDSITNTNWPTSWPPYLYERYCYLVAQELGMTLTNYGVSGMMMLDNGTYSYPIKSTKVEGVHRSFARELFGNHSDIVEGSGYEYRGPNGVDLSQYDLITLMLGSNDRQQIFSREGTNPGMIGSWNDTQQETLTLNNFYNAYYKAVKRIVEVIQNTNTVLVLCVPPKATGAGFRLVEELKEPIVAIANSFISEGKNVAIVNFYDIEETIELKDDSYGVHPTADGHIVLANYLKLRLGQIVNELNLRNR